MIRLITRSHFKTGKKTVRMINVWYSDGYVSLVHTNLPAEFFRNFFDPPDKTMAIPAIADHITVTQVDPKDTLSTNKR